jgi:hypothetical protein
MYLFCNEFANPSCWFVSDLQEGKKKYKEENEIELPDNKIFEYGDPIMISKYSDSDTVYYTKLDGYTEGSEIWILELIYSGRTIIYYEYSQTDIMKLIHQLFNESTRRVKKKDIEAMNKSLLENGTYEIPDKLLSEDEQGNYHHFTMYKILL